MLGSNDVGKDAYVDIVVDGDVSGDVIALQIKGGESFRRARGYAIHCTAADRELWRSSSIPVFGVVHDAGKLHWTNLTAWARALASDMRPAAAPVEATFALDERRLPGFLGQARAYLRADGPLRCAPAAPAASFSAVHANRAALAPAIQVLTLTVGHGDIFWTPDNWLPEPFATPSAASFAGPQPRSSS